MDRACSVERMRIAAWGGFLFVICSGAIVVLSPFWPPLGASTAEVVAYYRDHRVPFLIGNLLAIAAAVPSFAQLGALCGLIKRAEGERGWLWLAVLGSALLAHAVGGLALITYQVVPFELDVGQEAVARGLNDLAGVAFASFLIVLTGFVGFTGWAVLETRVLPRWFGLACIPLAVACLHAGGGALTTEPRWLAGGGLATTGVTSVFFLWCAVLSVLFLRRPVD